MGLEGPVILEVELHKGEDGSRKFDTIQHLKG